MVPPNMANEVVIKLLDHINCTYRLLRCRGTDSDLEDVASEILCAVIHPNLRSLDFEEHNQHRHPLDLYKIRTPPFIYMSLGKLENLTVLNVGFPYQNINGNFNLPYVPETLKRFSSSNCKDKDIEVLSIYCKGLESLDFIDTYPHHVSDNCLKYLVNFRHLKELYLGWDRITQDGLTWLLNELSCTLIEDNAGHVTSLSTQLIGFGCDNPNNVHIIQLASGFQNLQSLRLTKVQQEIDLTRLADLKYLSKLTLSYDGDLEEVLKLIGPQLKCLDISLHSVSSMKWIHDYCPSVRCLHLSVLILSKHTSSLMAYFETNPLPEFISVKSLHLSLCNRYITDYVVSRFVNVKKLSIFYNNSPSLFENIVLRKQLRHLEQLFWDNKIVVEFSEDKAIITKVIDGYYSVGFEDFPFGYYSVHKTQTWISSFTACE
jgi:hypothetical protein